MTVKELKKLLNDFEDTLEVTLSDYADDSDEQFTFRPAEGIEIVKTDGGKNVLSIFFHSEA